MSRAPGLLLVLLSLLVGACAGGPVRQLPKIEAPPDGFWFDQLRASRMTRSDPRLLAGAARVKITPQRRVTIAGHGFNKHSAGVLDDLWARVLYLDAGAEVVVLVSVDVIGLSLPRIERIRARVSAVEADRILIAATHNHFGPDTLGYWGPAAFGLLPVRSGIDPAYLDALERRVARAIQIAASVARPAELAWGGFEAPAGLAENVREPEDLPRRVRVLRATDERGRGIATLVNYACHAEALQDRNRWLTADFPGVIYREVDAALGGVTLFFSGPAGGMIEPVNDPKDSEAERLAFRESMGGQLAKGVIQAGLIGLQTIESPRLSVRTSQIWLPVAPDGVLDLAIALELLDPRPLQNGRLQTALALVELGPLRLLTVPGEPTPEMGRALTALLGGREQMLLTLGLDELAYFLSERQWADPRFEYERSMSLGLEASRALLDGVRALVKGRP